MEILHSSLVFVCLKGYMFALHIPGVLETGPALPQVGKLPIGISKGAPCSDDILAQPLSPLVSRLNSVLSPLHVGVTSH